MDTLVLAIERLFMGANITLETGQGPNADWLAGELRKIYEGFPDRTGDVVVRVTSATGIQIDKPGGALRHLRVAADGKSWELTNVVNGSTPGQISVLLGSLT